MKTGLALLLTFLLALQASALEVRAPRRGQGQGRQGQNHQGQSTANNGNNATTAATGNNGNNGGSTDPQDSLTLDPSVICTACTDDGQNPPVAEQSASLTSSNNFINYCQGKTLTNGQQLVDGSCNAVVYGDIIPSANMPASKISNPKNGGTFPANTAFTFTMNIENMVTGNFVNADTNYYGAPQQLQGGVVVGHSHVVMQLVPSLGSTDPLDPTVFAFFKGINTKDQGGVLSVDVTAGLPAGVYRICSINTNANHTPVMVAIAQHGSLDDCIYATAVDGGNNGGNNTGSVADNNSSTSAAAGSTSSAAAAATSSAAATGSGKNRGGQGKGKGKGTKGRNHGHARGRHSHKRAMSKVFA